MAIKFIVDSAADFSAQMALRMGLDVLPIGVTVDGKAYLDGVDIDLRFLEKEMKGGADVKTNHCTYQDFYDAFIKYAEGEDEVVYFSFTSGISSNYEAALVVANEIKEKYPDYKLTVVDTKLVLTGLQLFILDAIRLRDRGANLNMILDYLQAFRENLVVFATTDDLFYLVKGGRLSNSKAVIGNMLNVKPVVTLLDGKLVNIGKVRGLTKFYKYFVQQLKDHINKKQGSNLPVGISHFSNYDGVSQVQSLIEKQFGMDKFVVNNMSVAVGAHLGPSGIAVFYSPLNIDIWK